MAANYPATMAALAGVTFAAPVLAGFCRDWLVVSGQIDPHSTRYRTWQQRLSALFDVWLPPSLRVLVVLLSLAYLWPVALNTAQRVTFFLVLAFSVVGKLCPFWVI